AAGAEAQRCDSRREGSLNVSSKPGAAEVEIHGNCVDGREIEAGSGAMLDVRNPATGDVIAKIPNSTAEDIDRAMKSARTAFEGRDWGGMDIRARARLVNRLADAFEANLEQLYRLETLNNGRPLNETRAQLFTEAGLPPGVFNIVNGLGHSAGRMLAEHPDIDKLVLTGGTEAGRIAGGAAAKAFAHQTLELGGKTPVMVFDDFDVDQAVNYAAFGAF